MKQQVAVGTPTSSVQALHLLGLGMRRGLIAFLNFTRDTKVSSIFIGAWLLVSLSTPAHAYLDPVTGSFLIQGLIAGAVAVLAAIRKVRERVLGLFGFQKADAGSGHATDKSAGPAKPTANDTRQL